MNIIFFNDAIIFVLTFRRQIWVIKIKLFRTNAFIVSTIRIKSYNINEKN